MMNRSSFLKQLIASLGAGSVQCLPDAIINNQKERRREYLLHTFATEGKKKSSNFKHRFWEHENYPVLLDSAEMYNQRLNYLHWNPVTAGFVAEHSKYKVIKKQLIELFETKTIQEPADDIKKGDVFINNTSKQVKKVKQK